ncbi:MAG TPA: hypothetical protein VJZ04_01405 [Lachnospiraceae bacterium]|nr:hypothetical protein [Lachnospiraceae bacterium]
MGTTKGLAKLMSSYLTYNKSVNDRTEGMTGSGIVIKYTNYAGFTDSPMSSGYAKGFCHAEKLTKSIGALSAGASGSGIVSYSSIQNSGYGILAITASDVGTPVAVVPPAPSGTYEGYINTLSVTGNNGSYSQNALLRGLFQPVTSGAGSEALALSQSLSPNLSYSGGVAPVVYSGSSFELSVQSNSNIKTGLLQIDPSTFYGLTSVISTSTQSDYQAFTNEIKSNIYSEINMLTRDGGTLKGSYNYDPSSYVASGVQGGAFKSSSTRYLI